MELLWYKLLLPSVSAVKGFFRRDPGFGTMRNDACSTQTGYLAETAIAVCQYRMSRLRHLCTESCRIADTVSFAVRRAMTHVPTFGSVRRPACGKRWTA
eukprot:2199746-Pleurochrysis_carterae.AAC.3